MTALLALVLALQQPAAPPAAPRPAQPAAPSAPAPARRPAPSSVTLQIKVTDRSGSPLQGARVTADGPVSRDGATDASGTLQFRGVGNGTYRIRAEREESITLEKEVVIRGGSPSSVEFALAAAPPPPPPPPAPAPPPPPAPAGPAAAAGEARVLSIIDLAERSLTGRDPIRRVPVGCSGLDNTQLLVVRESLDAPAQPSLDQMLYVVAGEATLSMAGRDQTIASGWFAIVPRGTSHTLERRGRNPAIVLAIAGGQPCAPATTAQR
jgi:hypothetical protein